MKKVLLSLFTLFFSLSMLAQKPDWVTGRPVNTLNFTGIGMAKKTDKDYVQKAKQNALGELVSEIKVEVSANSLLNTIEDGNNIKQVFAESIKTQAKEEIEGFRLIDTWQDNEEYWVYYELNRFDYEEYMEARRQKAIKSGFDFWYKGEMYLQQGELSTAIEMFSKGLESIEPAINQDLTCSYDGRTINLGTEIYASLSGVFNGVSIITNPRKVVGTAFKGINDPIAIGVYKNNTPLRNIRLKAEFISGSGDLSSLPPTNDTGVTPLYIRNIVSKQEQQEVRISMASDAFKDFQRGINAVLFKKITSMLPETTLSIVLEETAINAYMKVGKNDLESLERGVKGILTNNFFNVVSSPSEADVIVQLDNTFKTGRKVPGDLYDFIECFSSASVQVTNNRTNATLVNYSANDIRTLVPADKSTAQAKSMASRELMKRLQRELGNEFKKITIDTEGSIPTREEPIAEPVVTPPPVVAVTPPVVVIPPVVKEPEPKPAPQAIRAELESGIYIEYVKLTSIRNISQIHFKIINETKEDFPFNLHLWTNSVFAVNEKGEELKSRNVKVGSHSNDHAINALIVPDLPTEMIVDVNKLEYVALFNLTDSKKRNIKMRNLK